MIASTQDPEELDDQCPDDGTGLSTQDGDDQEPGSDAEDNGEFDALGDILDRDLPTVPQERVLANPSFPETPTKDTHEAYVSFGSGIRLMSVAFVHKKIGPAIMSSYELRKLIRKLKVPIFWIGKRGFIDFAVFSVALKAVLRIGEPDFMAHNDSRKQPKPAKDVRYAKELDPERVRKLIPEIVQDLIAARELVPVSSKESFKSIVTEFHRAAERLAMTKVQAEQETTHNGRVHSKL